jgi:hypothetical protein
MRAVCSIIGHYIWIPETPWRQQNAVPRFAAVVDRQRDGDTASGVGVGTRYGSARPTERAFSPAGPFRWGRRMWEHATRATPAGVRQSCSGGRPRQARFRPPGDPRPSTKPAQQKAPRDHSRTASCNKRPKRGALPCTRCLAHPARQPAFVGSRHGARGFHSPSSYYTLQDRPCPKGTEWQIMKPTFYSLSLPPGKKNGRKELCVAKLVQPVHAIVYSLL